MGRATNSKITSRTHFMKSNVQFIDIKLFGADKLKSQKLLCVKYSPGKSGDLHTYSS